MRQEGAVVRLQPRQQPRLTDDAAQLRSRRPRARAAGVHQEPGLATRNSIARPSTSLGTRKTDTRIFWLMPYSVYLVLADPANRSLRLAPPGSRAKSA